MTIPALTALQRSKDRHGEGRAVAKLALLRVLARTRLRTAAEVLRLHEALCFLRAYPDDAAVLAMVERMLGHFHLRADLRQHRDELADSGIAGTAIRYRFFWATARWFAERWPGLFKLDRDSDETGRKIAAALPLLLSPAEAAALRQLDLPGFAAIDRIRKGAGKAASDATFWVRLIETMPGDTFTRQDFHDRIDAAYVLHPGAGTPARTHAWCAAAPAAFQTAPLNRGRPDLRAEMRRPPRAVRPVSAHEGGAIVELARAAMVTRGRDLDAFAYGDARDVRIVDDGPGFGFALIGTIPERRTLIPAIYGYLALRNGVPVGYGEMFPIGRFASITFNVFETFRGGEAARILARMLAVAHHVFGAGSFSLEPYQLGHDNDEAIASGAWWFYYKLGFRPLAAATRRVLRAELQRVKKQPSHRSSPATLRKLAAGPMLFDHDPKRVPGLPPLAAIGLRVADVLAARERSAGDRERALVVCMRDAMQLAGLRTARGMSEAERRAWRRWSPLLLAIPDVAQWTPAERRALAPLIRAKAGRRESDYAALFAAHPKLQQALLGSG
ncbi:MAG: hypothetical protein IPI73_10780 [Betaproteobacteria bacterium]|nr:hypothetical protein [Betaproteobacteria bacterium]